MGTTRRKAAAAAIALVVGCAPAVLAQDLLNPSFEDPENAAANPWKDLAAHWGRWGNWINHESAWMPTHSGSGLIGYHHWQIQEDASSGIFQDVSNTTAGASYAFSVYAYKDTGTDIEYVELRLEMLGGKDVIASKVYWKDEIQAGSWQPLSVSGMSAAPGLRVLVIVKPKRSGLRQGCLKFDDASLKIQD